MPKEKAIVTFEIDNSEGNKKIKKFVCKLI